MAPQLLSFLTFFSSEIIKHIPWKSRDPPYFIDLAIAVIVFKEKKSKKISLGSCEYAVLNKNFCLL